MVNATPWPLCVRECPGTHCTRGWVGRSGGLRKISRHTGVRTQDRPSSRKSLCRLKYPDPREGRSVFHLLAAVCVMEQYGEGVTVLPWQRVCTVTWLTAIYSVACPWQQWLRERVTLHVLCLPCCNRDGECLLRSPIWVFK